MHDGDVAAVDFHKLPFELDAAVFPRHNSPDGHKDDVGGADFINIKCLGRTAEWAEKWLSKGSKVEVTGKIKTGHYTKDGREVYYTEILASTLGFGESKAEAEARQGNQQPAADEGGFMNIPDGYDEELPFS